MEKYGLHGKLIAAPGKRDEFISIMLESTKIISKAKGCLIYLISIDEHDPDALWFTEVWESKEDHDNSLKMDSVRAVISQAMPLIGAPPQKGQELIVLGGVGI